MRGGIFLLFFVLNLVDVSLGGKFLYVLPIEDMFRDEWVESHNYYRRLVSNPEAANMRLMTWDDGLAALAEQVVRTCDFTHTSLGDLATSAFPEAGENLYSGGEHEFENMSGKEGITKAWYDEVNFYTYENRSCQTGKECGHYTQVVWADTYKVGCAVARCDGVDNGNTPYLVSCNYGPGGNIYDYDIPRPPYLSGNSCSECGVNDGCNDQLCNNTARDIPFTTTTTVTSAATTLSETTVADTTNSPEIAVILSETIVADTTSSPEIATTAVRGNTALPEVATAPELATGDGVTATKAIATSEGISMTTEMATDLSVAAPSESSTVSVTTEFDTMTSSLENAGNTSGTNTTSSGVSTTSSFNVAIYLSLIALLNLMFVSVNFIEYI